MYKTDLIRTVAKETRLSQRIVAEVLNTGYDEIREALKRGQEVQLPGFGTFYTRQRPEAEVRHIKTGKPVRVPAMRVAAFRVGDVLKRAVRKPLDGRRKKSSFAAQVVTAIAGKR